MNASIIRRPAAAFVVAVSMTLAHLAYGGSPPHYFGAIPETAEPVSLGVRLKEVRPDSPADKAGLREGDVVVQLGKTEIETVEDLINALRTALPGVPVPVTYYREGAVFETEVVLVARR